MYERGEFTFIKFIFSKKATVDLTLCSKCQIDGEDFVNFCGLLSKHELYNHKQERMSSSYYYKQANKQTFFLSPRQPQPFSGVVIKSIKHKKKRSIVHF